MIKTKIVFRADGGSEIGLGHVIRSLALAEMLKEDFDCLFAIQQPTNAFKQQVEVAGVTLISLPHIPAADKEFIFELDPFLSGKEIVVLDGYKFTTNYQQHIKNKGCSLVCIDDIHAYHFVADVVINHAVGFDLQHYSGEGYTQFFVGPSYALLRKEFLIASKNRSSNFLRKEVLITLGGADPSNRLLEVLENIRDNHLYRGYTMNIVLGSAYRHLGKLTEYINRNISPVKLHQSIDAAQMVELMKRAEVAICAPSTVSFEYLSVSEGKLLLVYLAENQREFYRHLTSNKIAMDFFLDLNTDGFDLEAKEKMKQMLDGQQKSRFIEIFTKIKCK